METLSGKFTTTMRHVYNWKMAIISPIYLFFLYIYSTSNNGWNDFLGYDGNVSILTLESKIVNKPTEL